MKIITLILLALMLLACSQNKQYVKEEKTNQTPPTINKNFPPQQEPPQFEPIGEELSPLNRSFPYISVNNAPLGEILQIIAEVTNLNIVVQRGVNLNAPISIVLKGVTTQEALNIIFASVGYFYKLEKNILKVTAMDTKMFELSIPTVIHNYKVDIGGDILGASISEGGGQSALKGGVSLETKADPSTYKVWDNIEETLNVILGLKGGQPATQESTATISPSIEPPTPTPPLPAEVLQACCSAHGGACNNMCCDGTPFPPQCSQGASNTPKITKTPDVPLSASVFTQTTVADQEAQPTLTINRITGTVIVTASKEKLERVEAFLHKLKTTMQRQVMIEARIVEVTLSDSLQYGINWDDVINVVVGRVNKIGVQLNNFANVVDTSDPHFALTLDGKDFSAIMRALQSQGNVKTLSNPKLNLLNGQNAVLTVGRKEDYIKNVQTTTTTASGTSQVSLTVNPSSILSGIMLGIVPHIDEDKNVSLTITPIISDLVDIQQKTFGEGSSKFDIGLPTIDLRELSTTVKVKHNNIVVLGGLIQTKESLKDNQVPFVGNIPVLGLLFKSRDQKKERTELVIMLKPYVVM
ncbi:MAG: pilus (MSHA type) biogenesis protein MshL [Candidatus Magnetoovum sp. WYHC-5]|nr:pilus (MSHA type) biogenesis protein MshL [Candidatus Magnetoovum sp. WYHC-5]